MANTTPKHFSSTAAASARSFDLSVVLASQIGRLSEAQLRHCSEAVDFFKKKIGSSETIENEFKILEEQENRKETLKMKSKFSISLNTLNKDKNRYPDVLPFDSNMVILKEHKEDYNPFSPTGYINASPVTTSDSVSRFIAAQGPLPETSEDFWEMIIQNKCPAIVMLTDLFDHDGNVKCGDYFKTKDGPREFGNISIVTKWMHTTESSLILRCIEVKNKKLEEPPFSVLHIQYPDWPDYGVPEGTAVVREIFETTSSSVPHDLGPIVVHCSAGVGRTGTYCVLHNTIERILIGDETALHLLDTVTKFRYQRVGMVHAKEQYEFCHKAIIDELENLINISI